MFISPLLFVFLFFILTKVYHRVFKKSSIILRKIKYFFAFATYKWQKSAEEKYNYIMKDFAKKFYKSQAWQDCRKAYIAKRMQIDGGLCEECHDAYEGHGVDGRKKLLCDFGSDGQPIDRRKI